MASKTLDALRTAVEASGKTRNAIAVETGLLPQTVHRILVDGTGDETMARYELIAKAVGKKIRVE